MSNTIEKSFGRKVTGYEEPDGVVMSDDMQVRACMAMVLDLLHTRRSYPGTDERQVYLCDKAIEKVVEAHGWAVSALMYQGGTDKNNPYG